MPRTAEKNSLEVSHFKQPSPKKDKI